MEKLKPLGRGTIGITLECCIMSRESELHRNQLCEWVTKACMTDHLTFIVFFAYLSEEKKSTFINVSIQIFEKNRLRFPVFHPSVVRPDVLFLAARSRFI